MSKLYSVVLQNIHPNRGSMPSIENYMEGLVAGDASITSLNGVLLSIHPTAMP
jgi:hypothetical protein